MLAGVNRLRRARGIGSQLFSIRSDEGLSSGAGQSFATFLTWSPIGSPKSCDGPFLRRLAVSGERLSSPRPSTARDKGTVSNKDGSDGPTVEHQEAASAADGHESPLQPGSEPQSSGPEVGSSTSGPEEPADAAKDELMALFEEQLRKLAGALCFSSSFCSLVHITALPYCGPVLLKRSDHSVAIW